MTPSQLEHLKLIDAHLERLLDIAAKWTPGEWSANPETLGNGRLFNTINSPESFVVHSCSTLAVHENAAFIASCAGPAEAGWKATIAAIDALNEIEPTSIAWRCIGEPLASQIIIAWEGIV